MLRLGRKERRLRLRLVARGFGHGVPGVRFTLRLRTVAVHFVAPDRSDGVARRAMCAAGLRVVPVQGARAVACSFVSANVTRGLVSTNVTRPAAAAIVSRIRARPVAAAVIPA